MATKDRPVRITMRNTLPANRDANGLPVIANSIPIDQTLPMWNGAMGAAQGWNRICVHVHGGLPPWISDGTPFQDFDPNGGYGFSARQNGQLLVPPDMVKFTDPGTFSIYQTNQQSARFLWMHDHAMDLTRLNAYAGLATGYVITDGFETGLAQNNLIPGPLSPQTVYLVIQDKSFNQDGSLWYPREYEADLTNPGNLPLVNGPFNYPLDGQFFTLAPALIVDATGNTSRWPWAGFPAMQPPAPPGDVSLVPEAFFDTIVVNGCAYPYAEVQPRHYRLRILNGSQARAYNLQLYKEAKDANGNWNGEPDFNSPGPQFMQIGNECGFLPAPTMLPAKPDPNNPLQTPVVKQQAVVYDTNQFLADGITPNPTMGNVIYYNLALAPAERADLIVDLTGATPFDRYILYSDAPAPWPSGDPRNEYFTGDTDYSSTGATNFGGAPTTQQGHGPNTRTLMEFRIVPRVGPPDPGTMGDFAALTTALAGAGNTNNQNITTSVDVTRQLTLNETFEDNTHAFPLNFGRLVQFVGGTTLDNPPVNQWGDPTLYRAYEDGVGEAPKEGATEIWEIFNLTADTHPMHFHLVNVQIINRQKFQTGAPVASGAPSGYLGAATAPGVKAGDTIDPTPFLVPDTAADQTIFLPDDNEKGYKETVRMNPGTVTRVKMRFDLPKNLPFPVPVSTRLADPMSPAQPDPNQPNYNPVLDGYEYVWHCHILEHEEHDMMHALVVKPT